MGERSRTAGRVGKEIVIALTGGALLYAMFGLAQFALPGAGGGREGGMTTEASAAATEAPPIRYAAPAKAEGHGAGNRQRGPAVSPDAGRGGGAVEPAPGEGTAGAETVPSVTAPVQAPAEGIDAEEPVPIDGSAASARPAAGPGTAPAAAPSPSAAPAAAAAADRVALTFDDGPDGRYTPMVLDILKSYGVKATFFVVGKQAEQYPEVLLRIREEGHEIGSHGYGHTNMEKLTPEQIAEDLDKTDEAIASVTGEAPVLFRAPYGIAPQKLKDVLEASDRGLAHWTVDTRDWAGTPKDDIVDEVMETVKPGGIVLMHSFGGKDSNLDNTIEALPVVIERLQEAGYTLAKVSELEDERP